MWENVKEWTSTLPSELPLWELESRWTPKFLESDCKGQNLLDWGIPYIIENLLGRKCLKCVCMTHLGT
jgi:L-rhamnose isomerase